MTHFIRPVVALLIALSLAACAAQSAQVEIQPPPKKQLDAKTQLETGKKY